MSQTDNKDFYASTIYNNSEGAGVGGRSQANDATSLKGATSESCLKELFHLQMLDEDSKLGLLFSTKVCQIILLCKVRFIVESKCINVKSK